MKKYICKICNYIYNEEAGDPRNNIPPNTTFESLPEEWKCPICMATKDKFYLKYELKNFTLGKE